MKDLKGGVRGSVFPLKLFLIYILCLKVFPWFLMLSIADNCEEWTEAYNWYFGWSLVLSGPLFIATTWSLLRFRKMPIFGGVFSLISLWLVVGTINSYFYDGFDPRMEINWSVDLFVRAAMVFAIPFLAVYLGWRFWPQTQAGGLPAN
jgi:hypothetical protein